MTTARQKALDLFRAHGGLLRTTEAVNAGIHPRTLYALRDSGEIEFIERGLFGLPDLPDVGDPDLAIIAKIVPEGVICLTSALYLHRLTVQIPRWIDVAVPKNYVRKKIQHPPIKFHWFGDKVFSASIEMHDIGGFSVRVYSPEKTIVDCFRLRSKVGTEVAVEALKNYCLRGGANLPLLAKLARQSRMSRIIQPYLHTIIYDQS